MNIAKSTAAAAAAASLVGCSSAPRDLEPQLARPATDETAYRAAFDQCQRDVAAGKRSNFREGRATTAGVGAAVGLGAGTVMASSAAAGAGMMAGPAAAVALGAGMVVFAPVAIFASSRMIRAGKEKEIKAAMTACLAEEGYTVAEWRVVKPARAS